MEKNKLDLLGTVQLMEVTGNAGVKLTKTHKNPTNADMRLFSDGSIYPSEKLVEEFDLEYREKDSDKPEFGFDIFQTEKWGMWPLSEHFVLIAPVSKHMPKVDVFSKTSYDKDDKPRASVLTQGASTFGKRLIEMLKQTYREELFTNGNTYVDLLIMRESPVAPVKNGIYNIPKMLTKGEKSGSYTYTRRENITIYPLIIDESSIKKDEIQDPAIDELAALGAKDDAIDASSGAPALVDQSSDEMDIDLDEAKAHLGIE